MEKILGKDRPTLRVEAPAKINLMLSVHGRRSDGFHALTSLIVAVNFGDSLEVREIESDRDLLICNDLDLPKDDSNLVLKAARIFRDKTGIQDFFEFSLTKRIPVGAGLGGGSSDGVAALKALNEGSGNPLTRNELLELAAELGSDCPFFVTARPALMRGRGEIIEELDEALSSRLNGRKLVLFRPPFGVNTGWAYGQLAKFPDRNYTLEADAMECIASFRRGVPIEDLMQNSFEAEVGRKYLALALLLEKLRNEGYKSLMSGSGSCCFAFAQSAEELGKIIETCRNCWGENIFWVETSIC